MTAILHNQNYNPLHNMNEQYEEADFPLFTDSHHIYAAEVISMNNLPTFNMDPALVAYNFQRSTVTQDPYANPNFASEQHCKSEAAPEFAKGSPTLYPTGSPELRCPLPSNLSSASGPSAASSAIGSPYATHAQIPSAISEWTSHHGLGLAPTIAGDYSYANDFSFGASLEHDFAFADMNKPMGFVDPSILHSYTGAPIPSPMPQEEFVQQTMYPPHSPSPSEMSSRSSKRVKSSASPYMQSYAPYPYPSRRGSIASASPSSPDSSSSTPRTHCPFATCGKSFKDLKAHMLTHQTERPEKCPITTCEYHTKGFARKYDKNRHTLTHYKGTMVCGFCPGSGSAAEKSFNRADVFKRHLTGVHCVEQVPPNSRRKTSNGSSSGPTSAAGSTAATTTGRPVGYAPDATGRCSTCGAMFPSAQDFYEHLDDCVLRLVQQEEPAEAINAERLAEVSRDRAVLETLRASNLPTTTPDQTSFSDAEDGEDDAADDEDDDENSARPAGRKGAKRGLTHSKGGVALTHPKGGRKKRKDYPSSWGCPAAQMKMKKRVLCVFDGGRRLWKDDMMLSADFEVRVPLGPEGAGRYVTDLDVQTLRRAEGFHGATGDERGEDVDLEELME
ncbi:hypothetical protein VE01_01145 [Pseudogymnoascus verrucosus]|uniref:C2H2-type domain-containing protein n=1 Tax=Pseudogymnoascus verrucosus TaxID=342668 RepID=A0A1B8GXS6_9PEZI|nr:uncharacterized protein VE01_01145 [Pseudogymnoascus verrucosus]OBU00611.2 hypothetical protein VE01_01145 [Pseudogymnoascus verrucosus]